MSWSHRSLRAAFWILRKCVAAAHKILILLKRNIFCISCSARYQNLMTHFPTFPTRRQCSGTSGKSLRGKPSCFAIYEVSQLQVWAYAVLFSRAVRLDFPVAWQSSRLQHPSVGAVLLITRNGEDGPDEEDMVALVPYIDLINHNPNSESRIRGVRSTDRKIGLGALPELPG